MASPPGSTSSYQRVEAVPSEQQKQLFALQYGSPNAPGRIMLREASRLGRTIEDYNRGKPGSVEAYWGYTPSAAEILAHNPDAGKINPKLYEQTDQKTAANGGLMTLRGYAGGGNLPPAPKNETPAQRATRLATYADKGGSLNSTQQTFVQNYYDNQAVANKNGYQLDYKTGLPVPPKLPASATTEERNAAAAAFTEKTGFSVNDKGQAVKPITDTATNGSGYTPKQALETATPGVDAAIALAPETMDPITGVVSWTDPYTGKTVQGPKPYEGVTNQYARAYSDAVTGNQMPAEYGAASQMYQQAGAGLASLANFTPSSVSAQSASAGTSSAGSGSASQAQAAQMGNVADVTAPEMQYFQADRGNIRDATANQAAAYGYDASSMQAPQGIEALGYDASQINREDVRDVNAQLADVERYNASLMNAPSGISAQAYEAALAGTNQMNMPSSWTEAGTAGKYMNPYIQNVVDIQKREANRDYQKQLNELNKQAVGAKAYGGSRLAIERAEAARNQATKLADIEAEGLNQAYQQGMGQFTTEQGQTLQAGQANLTAAQQSELANQQALNTQRQIYVTQQLEAAKNNYMGQLTAAQQNMIAKNAASEFNAQAQNTAYNNYVAQQLAASQSNQQSDINLAAANQAALNAQKSQYVTQALQAAQNNYGGQLTAAQQNQVAQNAASQFYAQSQNQSAQAYAAQQLAVQQLNQGMDAQTVMANLQANLGVQGQEAQQILNAALANQQTQFGIGSLNANLANQTALTNAQLGTQASLQNAQLATQSSIANAANQTQISGLNAQNALQAQMANQSAGIAGANIGLNAYSAMGTMGAGLTNTGNSIANWNTGNISNLGTLADKSVGFGNATAGTIQGNALNQQTGAYNTTSGPIQITQGTATTPAGQAGTTGTR